MEIRVKGKKKRLKRKQKQSVILIAVLVCTLLAMIGIGVAKVHSGRKANSATTGSLIDKQENLQVATATPMPPEVSGSAVEPTATPEVTPGDMEVTEVAVESEELSEEEIAQIEKKRQENNGNTTPEEVTNPENPYFIRVNRLANCVTIYGKDVNGAYTVPVKAMICSVGKNVGSTPAGVFSTYAKYTWRYLFGEQYGQYTTRIVGHILFHSVPYSQPKKDMLKTDYYNNLGIADSMGCIRLTVADAKWIYDNCPLGTTVEIYDDTNPGPLGKPSAMKIDPSSPYAGWDPTDPDPANPWKAQNLSPMISGVKNMTIERTKNVNLLSHVSATDYCGGAINVTMSGTVDTNICGNYNIIYTATDALGNTSTATATVTVVDTTAPKLSQAKQITINDSTTDLELYIKNALSASDENQVLGTSSIVVDMTPLQTAIANKVYGNVICNAYAVDGSGNRSNVLAVKVVYEFIDLTAPIITVLDSPTIEVMMSGEETDEEKKQVLIDSVLAKVQDGSCYEVSDDVSEVEDIVIEFATDDEIGLTGNITTVIVTVRATDEAGNSSRADVKIDVVCN